jgi:Fe-S cluster assembly scaffold protein SufB
MRISQDIIDRVNDLERTLVWVKDVEAQESSWNLVSDASKRLVARVFRQDEGHYRTSTWQYERENSGYIFLDAHSAMEWAKFNAIKSTLEEELRRATIQ